MHWFKHYNTASQGQSFELLIAEKDFETAYIYWWLLEQVSRLESTSQEDLRGKVTLNFAYFKRKLGLNFQRTERVLLKIAKTFDLEIKLNLDQTIEVFVPKWLELQENRGGKRDAKELQSLDKNRQEVRSKNKELEVEEKSADNLPQKIEPRIDVLKLRFSPMIEPMSKVLASFAIDKNLKKYMSHVVNTFKDEQDLNEFLLSIERSKAYQKNLEQNKKYDAIKYMTVSLKKHIGVMND